MEVGKGERSWGSLYSVVLISQWSGGKFFYYWSGLEHWGYGLLRERREVDEDFEYSQSLSVMGRKADQGEIKGVRATWRFKSHWFVGNLGYLACDVSLATLGFLDTGVRQMCEEKRPMAGESAVRLLTVCGRLRWMREAPHLPQSTQNFLFLLWEAPLKPNACHFPPSCSWT